MSKRRADVYCLYSLGEDAFAASDTFEEGLKAAGAVCRHCRNIIRGHGQEITEIVAWNEHPVGIHHGTIGGAGGCDVLSNELIRLIGRPSLERVGWIVPLLRPDGRPFETHQCLVDRERSRGFLRGPISSDSAVCLECGRVLCWPGWPPSKWYLLKQYWLEGFDCQFVGMMFFVSASIWETRIRPCKLDRLSAHRVALVDAPSDGMPADAGEFEAEVRRRGMKR